MEELMLQSISFNVSKTVNIGNFEAIKINYGETAAADPTRDIDEQRKELIENCYAVVKKETEIWQKLHKVQHIDSNKNRNVIRAKSV